MRAFMDLMDSVGVREISRTSHGGTKYHKATKNKFLSTKVNKNTIFSKETKFTRIKHHSLYQLSSKSPR